MSIEAAKAYLTAQGVDLGRVLEFSVSSATVELAALAVGCAPQRIAKSLSFRLPGPGEADRILLIIAAGDAKVDNAKYKTQFHHKAKMLSHDEAETLIGHGVGGVCPFGVNSGVEVWLDQSLRRFDTVYPAVGSANSAIQLTIPELASLSQAQGWVDVCKLPET